MSTVAPHAEEKKSLATNCCIVGAGPAGAVLALLLARKGIPVVLLEAAKDFDRDFRGDTIHPTTLEIMSQLGLVEDLLQLPHTKMSSLSFQLDGKDVTAVELSRLALNYPYIALMPQARFIEFIVKEAQRYPNFRLIMRANVSELIKEHGRVQGVRYRTDGEWHEVRALITIGADGRSSRLRTLANLKLKHLAPPLELLWFRLNKPEAAPEIHSTARFSSQGRFSVVLNRDDHWQVGYFIRQTSYQQVRKQGLALLREAVVQQWPEIGSSIEQLHDWKQVSHLAVQVGYLPRWYVPGLLFIGDAAHVMSPLGGFGINLAVQDAVVAAKLLSEALQAGESTPTSTLAAIQKQRTKHTRIYQTYQTISQRRLIAPVLDASWQLYFTRMLLHLPLQRILLTRLITQGTGSVRVPS